MTFGDRTSGLNIGDQVVPVAAIPLLLVKYRLMPQFLREYLIDQAIQSIPCSEAEQLEANQALCQRYRLGSLAEQQDWLQRQGLTMTDLARTAQREYQLEKFKKITWGAKLEAYFLEQKSKLDRAIYSLIRLQDMAKAQELYFRIAEGEQSFPEVARLHSLGAEAQTGGIVGPVELSSLHPSLARGLEISQPGQLWPPARLGEWVIIVRLERFIPAQLDESMRQRLLNQLFENWLQPQLDQAVRAMQHETASLPIKVSL